MTDCPGMCVLAIVGSVVFDDEYMVDDADRAEALRLIEDAFARHRPSKFISGGADGIDTMAEEVARRVIGGSHVRTYLPRVRRFHGDGGYRERDEWIAVDCEHLVRIAHAKSRTYGSGWTADQAEKLGKKVERFVVGSKVVRQLSPVAKRSHFDGRTPEKIHAPTLPLIDSTRRIP